DHAAPCARMRGDNTTARRVSNTRSHALNKPIVVGETGIHTQQISPANLAERALLFQQKFSAQFTAGVAGELIWNWSIYAPSSYDYELGPADPSLALLGKF